MTTPGLLFTSPESPEGRECARKLDVVLSELLESEREVSAPFPGSTSATSAGAPGARRADEGAPSSTEVVKTSECRLRLMQPVGE